VSRPVPPLDLDALVAEWRGPLVGLLAARGATPAEAHELAQDVFAEAWLSRERFRGDPSDPRAVGGWLAGIARNLHRTASRRHERRALPLEAAAEVESAGESAPAEDPLAPLRAAIERLPERERIVVQAFYLEETTTKHVAALLHVTPRAVEGLLRRARARLASWLEEAHIPR